METAGPGLDSLQEDSVTTVASKLSCGICNAPQMEMFIWSCSTEASHWIKTSLRVTCGFYLSLQLPDSFPQNHACQKRPIAVLARRRRSSLAPRDRKARLRGWKWQRWITARRCVWQPLRNLFYKDTRGDLPLICCNLIQSDSTNLHPLHVPKTVHPYLSCYKPYLDANRKLFLPCRWLFKDAWGL